MRIKQRQECGQEGRQGKTWMWRGVVYGTADEIKYRFGYVEPIDLPVPVAGRTQIRQRYTQARTESETERPAPLDADANDKSDKPADHSA